MTRAGLWGLVLALTSCAAEPRPLPYVPAATESPRATPPPPRADGRLSRSVRPVRYRVELTVDPRETSYSGRVRIDVTLDTPTRAIVLHALGPRVLTAAVRAGSRTDWPVTVSRPSAGSPVADELVLMLERELVGTAELDLQFEAPFSDGLRGLYRVSDGGRWFAFSQMQPADARRAFPCFDEPGFKTPFEITLTVPAGDRAFGNQPETARREHPQSLLVTHEFSPSPPLPTYLLAFATGPLHTIDATPASLPVRLIATTEAKAKLGRGALDVTLAQLKLVEEYFEERMPYPKLDLVAVPEFGAGAMENPGLMTFREELLLLDEERAPTVARRNRSSIIAHELAHQWLGNLVTPVWWDDLWLNEGLATWMASKISHAEAPSFGVAEERASAKAWAMRVDVLESARSVRQPVPSAFRAREAFDAITYVKGAAVIHMLEGWLGQEAVQKALIAYVARHRHGSATSADLFRALDQSNDKASSMLKTFVEQPGVPLVDMTVECKTGQPPRIVLRQEEYLAVGRTAREGRRWTVPVCLRVHTGAGSERLCSLLDGPEGELRPKACPTVVVPNDQESGYYRWQLPESLVLRLFKEAPARLSAMERAGLVANARSLVEAGRLPPFTFVGLLSSFARETERAVWEQIVQSLSWLERVLPPDARARLATETRKLFGPVATRLGTSRRATDSDATRMTRVAVLRALTSFGDDDALRKRLADLGRKWLDGDASVDDDVAGLALAAHARGVDAAGREALLQRLDQARDRPTERLTILAALVEPTSPERLQALLDLTLTDRIKVQDLRYVFPPLFERPQTAELTAGWLFQNFDGLTKRLPSFAVTRVLAGLGEMCDPGPLAKGQPRIQERAARVEGGLSALTRALERATLCAELRRAL